MRPDVPGPGGRGGVLLRLIGLCWRHPWLCCAVIACQVAVLVLGMLGLAAAGLGIDYLSTGFSNHAVHWPLGLSLPRGWSPMQTLASIAAAVLLAGLVRTALAWRSGILLATLVHRRVISDLQRAVFSKVQQLDFGYLDRHSRGEVINRATGDIQSIRVFVDTVLVQAVVTALTILVYVAYMATIRWTLTAACLAALPLGLIVCAEFSRRMHPLYLASRELFDRMVLSLVESIEGILVIKGFALEKEIGSRFQERNRRLREQQGAIFLRVSLFTPSVDLLTQLSLVVLLLYGGRLVIAGQFALGTGLVVFAGLLQQFSNQITTIAQIANNIQESLTGAARVFDLLDACPALAAPAKPYVPLRMQGSVLFDGVWFSHGSGKAPVLQNIHIEVQPGECVAIVGETGSGKSALLNLIPRFYDPSRGRVLVDGIDARQFDTQALRRGVSMVFQENFLFSDTVAANIAFGRPEAGLDQVRTAARAACADEFIEALPRGYQTVLGEGGVDLSGGQRQRLTIARALLADPAILLLDDPTAAIDSETEQLILRAIDRALAGRTTFVVAHRLSTLRRAHRIIVLKAGRIVQMGTHAELMRAPGHYRAAAMHQLVDAESRMELGDEMHRAGEGRDGSLTRDGEAMVR